MSYLIVNADDYGYFSCVSEGILEAATRGIVTATGVISNRADFEEQADGLRACGPLDAGIHLNLTFGAPLTGVMQRKCSRWAGMFPGMFGMIGTLLSGAVTQEDVASEWRAQIERCLASGLELRFLNSHEHIHMLPSLFDIASALSKQYGIRHVRFTLADRPSSISAVALMRSGIMTGLQLLSKRKLRSAAPRFLGLHASGRIDEAYFRCVLPTLRPGCIYELMCHPGHLDRNEIQDSRLLAYHNWEGELTTLTSPTVRDLLRGHGVSVIGYRDLDLAGNELVARARSTMHARLPR